MSTFRVVNNYSDGYVDENGFVRRNIHEVVKEIEKKIDMIDPNADNNEFITKVENHMNAVNQTVMNQNMNIDNINMQLNRVIEPKLNDLATKVGFEVPILFQIQESQLNVETGDYGFKSTYTDHPIEKVFDILSLQTAQRYHDSTVLKDVMRRLNNIHEDELEQFVNEIPSSITLEESKTNGSTGNVGYNTTKTNFPIEQIKDMFDYHSVQRGHDATVIKDILRRINNMNLDLLTRVEIKKSDWTSNHTGYRYYQYINGAASDGRESFTITEPFPSDYNTLSEYLSALSKSVFGYINEIFIRLVQVEHKLWDTQLSIQTSSTSWNDYLKDKPDTKYLDI